MPAAYTHTAIQDASLSVPSLPSVSGGVVVISDKQLNIFKDNILIHKEGDYKVYQKKDGIKHLIKNRKVFNCLGFDWNEIAPVNQAEFNFYENGASIE